jgi:hypothetical protein
MRKSTTHESFVLEFWEVPKIDEKADIDICGVKVVENLGAIFACQAGHRLDLDDYAPETDEVGLIDFIELALLVTQFQDLLGFEQNFLSAKFDFQTLLIYGFQKSAPHLVIHLETRTQDPIRLFLEREVFTHFPLLYLCSSV